MDIRKCLMIIAMISCLVSQPTKAEPMDWFTFATIVTISSGINFTINYVVNKHVVEYMAAKAGDQIRTVVQQETEKLKDEFNNQKKLELPDKIVKDKSINLSDYVNPPKEILVLMNQLKNPQRYGRMGITLPKGLLLVGDPGTGKTFLARALAGELDCPFFEYSATDFIQPYLGKGSQTIQAAFSNAREQAKKEQKKLAIIFIDEFDGIGSRSDATSGNIAYSQKELINTFLTSMDGFAQQQPPILVIAATNYLDNIDEALKRKGRFDQIIHIPYPDQNTREQLLQKGMRKTVIDKKAIGLEKKLATITHGFSQADLKALINNAARNAIEQNIDSSGINYDCFIRAVWNIKQRELYKKTFSTISEGKNCKKL